jgi:hypothetical protein
MGKPPRSPNRFAANGAGINLLAPPLPVLDRPGATALLELLRRAASENQADLHASRDEERVRS